MKSRDERDGVQVFEESALRYGRRRLEQCGPIEIPPVRDGGNESSSVDRHTSRVTESTTAIDKSVQIAPSIASAPLCNGPHLPDHAVNACFRCPDASL